MNDFSVVDSTRLAKLKRLNLERKEIIDCQTILGLNEKQKQRLAKVDLKIYKTIKKL